MITVYVSKTRYSCGSISTSCLGVFIYHTQSSVRAHSIMTVEDVQPQSYQAVRSSAWLTSAEDINHAMIIGFLATTK